MDVSVSLAESAATREDTPTDATIIADVTLDSGKRLGVSERAGDASSRALMRYSAKREKFARTSRLSDIADALDVGLIG